MKKIFWSAALVFFMGCGDILDTQYGHRSKDSVNTQDYIVMPEVVITVDAYQEIIFTEDEVRDAFEDPTEFGSEHFSAIYVPQELPTSLD